MSNVRPILRAKSRGLFTSDFIVTSRAGPPVLVRLTTLGERGSFEWEGTAYRALGRGYILAEFSLHEGPHVVATARKLSIFRNRAAVRAGGRAFVLEPTRFFAREFSLLEGDEPVGRISSPTWMGRDIEADLPEDLPYPDRVFLIWVVWVLRRRHRRS